MTEFIEYVMKKFLKDEYEERRKIHEDEVHVSLNKKNQFVNKQLIFIYLFFPAGSSWWSTSNENQSNSRFCVHPKFSQHFVSPTCI